MADIPNVIDATLSDDVLAEILAEIDAIEKKMPFALALTPAQRQALPKLGQDRVGFVNQAFTLVQQNDSYMPRAFNVEQMEHDVTLMNQLLKVETRLSAFSQVLRDTVLTASSEAYKAALIVYQSAKAYGPEEIQPTVKQMAQTFKTGGGSSTPQEEETE